MNTLIDFTETTSITSFEEKLLDAVAKDKTVKEDRTSWILFADQIRTDFGVNDVDLYVRITRYACGSFDFEYLG